MTTSGMRSVSPAGVHERCLDLYSKVRGEIWRTICNGRIGIEAEVQPMLGMVVAEELISFVNVNPSIARASQACGALRHLLDGFNVGDQIADFQLDQCLVLIHGTESVSPQGHVPGAMVSDEVVALNDAGDDLARELAAVFSAKLSEIRRMFFEARRSSTVALGIGAMTTGAIGTEDLLPCPFRSHRRRCELRLFLRKHIRTECQKKDQYRLGLLAHHRVSQNRFARALFSLM